jgi:RND family efflux transporter MFP subunit
MIRLVKNLHSLLLATTVLSVSLVSAEERLQSVSVQPLSELIHYPVLSVPASVISLNDAQISAEVSAVTKSISVNVGDIVEKGDILLQFDASDYRYALRRADAALQAVNARIELAQYQLERTELLKKQSVASEENLRQRQAELKGLYAEKEGLNAALGMAKQDLKKCVVRAPFRAVITARMAQLGELADKGKPLFQLVDVSRIEVSSRLQAVDVESLSQARNFIFKAQQTDYPLRLRVVTPVYNPQERSREARFVFVEKGALPGAAGSLSWQMQQAHLPADLLQYRDGQIGVFTLRDQRAKFVVLKEAREGRPAPIMLPAETVIIVQGRYALQHDDIVDVQ